MKVGIYFDLRNPPQWRGDWSRLYGFTLEMCEEAERLGADSVWFSEHHFFEDGYLPQPLTMAAAAATRTRRVRVGTAVVIAPLRRAVQLAEEAAIVDLISNGRLELGVGAGYRPVEFEAFDADMEQRYRTTDAMVGRLRELWSGGKVLPPPAQDRMPIWLGYGGPQGARRAGRMGEGLLSVDRELVEPYLAGLAQGGHPAEAARMAGSLPVFTTDDPERDWATVSRHHAYQWDSYRRYMTEGSAAAPPRAIDPERSRAHGLAPGMGNLLYGTPEDNAPAIRAHLAGMPVETVFFWVSLAGMSEEMVAAHVRTICRDLRPLLA
ncbi:LLM class flavin-dependent oxidoreductase [Nocardia sp. NPDC005366]|uniref:LLM class flavin-dependent oxidoreductase n=1 Tax=Nocardia sp. NPDC005366 TaxID=3156878 RepID=UPI0033A01547